MTGGRVTWKSIGSFVLQFFDAADLFTVDYDDDTAVRPLNAGARYTSELDGDGIPRMRQVDGTFGYLAGWLCWPAKSPRTIHHWAQAFSVKITSIGGGGEVMATPVATADGSGWTAATDLDELEVFTSDGTAPDVGATGIVVAGTDLEDQYPLFFQGGGGSATIKCFKVTLNNSDGTYEGVEYDEPGGSVVGDPLHPTPLKEDNLAPDVPVNQWVRGVPGVSVADTSVGDTDVPVFWFSMPFGCFT